MANLSKKNSKSQLLSDEENQFVFNVLGKGCFTLATGVAQLFFVRCHRNKHRWVKQHCGVVCFVKDNPKKSYYIRLYDAQDQKLLWEQEIYTKFSYNTPREYFHTFEAHDCHAALNFASEDEAINFANVVEGKLLGKKSKRQATRPENKASMSALQEMPEQETTLQVMTEKEKKSQERSEKETKLPNMSEKETTSDSSAVTMRNKKENQKKKKKLTTSDVGGPLNFVHVSHMSWGVTDGPHMDRLDDDMKALLKEIGIIEKSQVDNDTMEFIYDFVDRHGGANAVREDFAWHVSKKHHPSSESHTENTTSITRKPLPALPPETKEKAKSKVPTPITNPQDLTNQILHRKPSISTSAKLPTSPIPTPNIRPQLPGNKHNHPVPLPKPPLPNQTPNINRPGTAYNKPTSENNQNDPGAAMKTSNFNIKTSSEVSSVLPSTTTKNVTSPSKVSFTEPSQPVTGIPTASPENTITTQSFSTSVNNKGSPNLTTRIPSPPPPPPPPPFSAPPPVNISPPPPPPPPTFSPSPALSNSSTLPSHFPPPIQSQTSAENAIPPENKSMTGLLDEIQTHKGHYLKHVQASDHPPGRGGLLNQIRTGTILKHVKVEDKPTPDKRGSIATALMDQLIKRKTIVQYSDNEYSSDEFDDDWDDE